nr:GTP cyclohydrolase I FolE [Fusobacterium gastrosuis]
MNPKKIEKAFFEIIEALDDNREELRETPKRIAKSYEEIFSGINIDPRNVLINTFSIDNDDLILEKNIDFYSMCEHHFLPFFGQVSLAYVPNKKIFGFGDIIKLIEILSRRPQLQERLTEEIATCMMDILDCKGVYVIIEAKHLCMTMRGTKKENTKIITSSAKGIFEKSTDRKLEVLALLK